MNNAHIVEGPQGEPDCDLLGMQTHARLLARYLEQVTSPFTLGVYGEWGEGKTTFVNFLRHYIEELAEEPQTGRKTVLFIPFSAWPHSTSDTLWRALIIAIAKGLYEITDDDPEITQADVQKQPRDGGLWPLASDFLLRDALILRKPPDPEDPKAEYRKLLSQLDRTAYGSISKNADQHVQINQEVALMTIVNGAITALGAVSPLVAQLRTLFGMQEKIDVSALLQREKNSATRTIIESANEFKTLFGQVVKDKSKGRRVFVFVDDLDRCLPDVALDVLETIKILLDDTGCIFIVAADEHLIGQGLRLRYRAMLDHGDSQQVKEFFAQKGREYFEKIIQFGVHVPPRTLAQGYTFLAAQFPHWASASDIIQTAIGGNPRRLKQYCSLLSYRYSVAQAQEGAPNGGQGKPSSSFTHHDILDKVIRLYSWSKEALNLLEELAGRDDFREVLRQLEHPLPEAGHESRAEPGKAPPDGEFKIQDGDLAKRCQKVAASAPLRQLLGTQPLFSACDRNTVAIFARLADLTPDPEISISTRDPVFNRILLGTARRDGVCADSILLADMLKISRFHDQHFDTFELLTELSKSDMWAEQLTAIERELERTTGRKMTGVAEELLAKLRPTDDESSGRSILRREFLASPRFSTILRQELEGFLALKAEATATAKDETSSVEQTATPEPHRRTAAAVTQMLLRSEPSPIKTAMTLRIHAALELLERRRFAKVIALTDRWPELARQLRIDGPNELIRLETRVLNPDALKQGNPLSLDKELKDETLLRFLRLRPYFKDIYPHEFSKYYVATKTTGKLSEDAFAGKELQTTSMVEMEPYRSVYLAIERKEALVLRVTLRQGVEPIAEGEFNLTEQILARIREQMEEAFAHRAVSREIRQSSSKDAMAHIRELGSELTNLLFVKSELRSKFIHILRTQPRTRVVLELKATEIVGLPWESLYLPELQTFLGLTQKFSVMRHVLDKVNLYPRTLTPPIRLLIVNASPKNVPALASRKEIDTLMEALVEPLELGQVQIEVLNSATKEKLQHMLRVFRPHLFQFIGHGTFSGEDKQGCLVFENEAGLAERVTGEQLRTLLVNSNISLAVLNGCDTGTSDDQQAITSVAGALIEQGIPAAIATMRAVTDPAAVMFTRAFYRAFVDGYSVEASLTEARKALHVEGWDWPAYALFASVVELDSLRLIPKR